MLHRRCALFLWVFKLITKTMQAKHAALVQQMQHLAQACEQAKFDSMVMEKFLNYILEHVFTLHAIADEDWSLVLQEMNVLFLQYPVCFGNW